MLSRTYPSECSIYDCDDLVVTNIRGMISDPIVLKRFYIPVGGDFSEYVPNDPATFSNEEIRFWPYNIKVGGTVCSGTNSVQLVDYHHMIFDPSWDLTTSGIDFWVESFYFSDYEIWTSFLSVDLSPLVPYPGCITPYMEMLKAAADLVPIIRAQNMSSIYAETEVSDKSTSFKKIAARSIDPWGDIAKGLDQELHELLERHCWKKILHTGIRLE
jgi:hypothetical protein